MGYTHYWRNTGTDQNQKNYDNALKDIRKIIKSEASYLANGLGEDGTKPITRGQVSFNGIESESHETFSLPKTISELEDFDFCKTAQKEYDVVVVACLTVLKHHLKDAILVQSDGNHDEWTDGVALAENILGRKFKNPIETKAA